MKRLMILFVALSGMLAVSCHKEVWQDTAGVTDDELTLTIRVRPSRNYPRAVFLGGTIFSTYFSYRNDKIRNYSCCSVCFIYLSIIV